VITSKFRGKLHNQSQIRYDGETDLSRNGGRIFVYSSSRRSPWGNPIVDDWCFGGEDEYNPETHLGRSNLAEGRSFNEIKHLTTMSEPIKPGDQVKVKWNDTSNEVNAIVLQVPQETGDSWYFELENGTIIAQIPLSTNFDYVSKPWTSTPPK
jgi:hypothetical protein